MGELQKGALQLILPGVLLSRSCREKMRQEHCLQSPPASSSPLNPEGAPNFSPKPTRKEALTYSVWVGRYTSTNQCQEGSGWPLWSGGSCPPLGRAT